MFFFMGFLTTILLCKAYSVSIVLDMLICGTIVFVFCLSYHLCTGIRYLIWSLGFGFEMHNVRSSAFFILFITVFMFIVSMYLFFRSCI